MGESICNLCDQPVLNFQNTRTAHATQQHKNEQPSWKTGRRPNQTFLQRIHTDGQTNNLNSVPFKISLKSEGEMKTFWANEQTKLWEFVASWTALQRMF